MMRWLYLSLTMGVALAAGRAGSGAELQGERYEAEVPDTLDQFLSGGRLVNAGKP